MVINPCVCARPGQHAPDPATAEYLAKALRMPLAKFYATAEDLADIILLVSRLPPAQQKEALQRIRDLEKKATS